MSTTLPMNRQHDLAVSLIDVDGNVAYERAHQLLACSHHHVGRRPGCIKILGKICEIGGGRRRVVYLGIFYSVNS
ncbi:hypothetical protein [Rhizobium altiplani]|uniref:hypothetical protein n=1 Tax=Rhizobium altiplani TaxID=1864509 RepID=UPI000A742CC5